jgi:hypothetical protein
MKKVISSILILTLALTIIVSAMPSQQTISTQLIDQQMTQIVGGQKNQKMSEGGGAGGANLWFCVGAVAIGAVGIAAVPMSFGFSNVIAIYGLSLAATTACASFN